MFSGISVGTRDTYFEVPTSDYSTVVALDTVLNSTLFDVVTSVDAYLYSVEARASTCIWALLKCFY